MYHIFFLKNGDLEGFLLKTIGITVSYAPSNYVRQ